MNRVDFASGGVNPPHTHPRATESGVVFEGKLTMFCTPRGLVHIQLNVGEGKALLLVAFNSQLPGIALVPPSLFGTTPPIPNQVLTKAFQVGDDVINEIKSKFCA
ncbi:Germin [Parasponia andersonii]|uniref:Germin-like protein n=1 Tax=Parasponia andersonii TaxID=3476 RepID=A0A2P5CIY5_PARAD|nr:Germin [Parasponia andersonii]